jgi:hypothetical protein
MKPLLLSLLTVAALTAAPGKRKFTGIITDSMCPTADHSRMRMAPTDAECLLPVTMRTAPNMFSMTAGRPIH